MKSPEDTLNEHGSERIPTREDILTQIQKRCEGAELFQELSDDDGIYLLFARKQDEKPGEFTELIYQRKGEFPSSASPVTCLEKVCYRDNEPYWGENVAEYDSATGEWIDL